MWRFIGFAFFMPILLIGGCGVLVGLALGGQAVSVSPSPFIWLSGALALVFGVALAVRVVWRLATPAGDLVEAVSRVEAGDYTARAPERGPREIRALARAINTMAARLQADEQHRRNLLADVTHELRTPVTVIQGHLEGVLDGVYPADEAHLAPILDETRVLSRLIEDLRTLALAESGALPLHREATDLSVLASEVGAAFRVAAEAAGVRLTVQSADELPLLEVDPVRLREVLTNLLTNALRHTPRGGEIAIALMSDARALTLAVSDSGEGIPADRLPHIFDRFTKSEASPGSGLGLAIAKNLIAAHGGHISAESAPGQGTTIRVTLPLAERG